MRSSIAITLLAFPLLSLAHHSRSEYEFDELIVVSGEIVSVSWRNPHIELRLRATAADGSVAEWHLESASAVAMSQAGISSDTLQTGMLVRVAGGASTRRDHRMEFTNLLLPDDVEVVFAPRSLALWSDRFIGLSSSTAAKAGRRLPDDGRGIFRAWSWEPPEPGDLADLWMMRAPDQFPLTAAAKAVAASWNEDDPNDSLELQCIPPGMPSTMGNPHPIEFVEADGAIQMRSEEFDIVRTIHLTPAADPATVEPSSLGYSVGHWEGEIFVVETTRLNAPYFTRRGVPQSESARVLERFQVDAEQGRLTNVLTFTDPEYLTEPFVTELHWVWDERFSVQLYDCASSLSGSETLGGPGTNLLSLRNALLALGLLLLIGFLVRRSYRLR